jgi:hypothetical protein
MTEDMTPCLHPFERLLLKGVPDVSKPPPWKVILECTLCEEYLHLQWPPESSNVSS